MMGSEMIVRRSMLHMSRALFLPDAEDRCVMNLQKVIERLRLKRPRKMSGSQAYFHGLMLEVKTASRSAPHSSQPLKDKIMAQHVKLFNALSPSYKQGLGHHWPRISRVRTLATSRRMCSTMCTRSTQSYRGLEQSARSLA